MKKYSRSLINAESSIDVYRNEMMTTAFQTSKGRTEQERSRIELAERISTFVVKKRAKRAK